jgi:hypothetical protein
LVFGYVYNGVDKSDILIYLPGPFKEAYPDAKLIGPGPLGEKRNDLKFDGREFDSRLTQTETERPISVLKRC